MREMIRPESNGLASTTRKLGTPPRVPPRAPPATGNAPLGGPAQFRGLPTPSPPPRLPTVLKKFLLALLLFAALLGAVAYLGGGWLLGAATRAALPRLIDLAERTGLRVAQCEFASAAVRPTARLSWNDWRIDLIRPAAGNRETSAAKLRLRLGAVRLVCTDWAPLAADLSVEGGVLETPFIPAAPADLPFAADEFGVAIERIDDGFLTIPGVVLGTDPRPALAGLARDLEQLAREGRTARDLRLGARLHFQIGGEPLSVRLETARRSGATWLEFNAADIAELSRRHTRPLTAAEQRILCEHPQRTLLLLRIKEYAERLAQRLARTDRAYGEDFTRHVVWSYWLTRTFGADFAQQVTDAHETGAADNTEAQHRQDFANNSVGRSYALAKKSEGQVLRLIKTDPQIVRVAQ